jgi:hypothetical protein
VEDVFSLDFSTLTPSSKTLTRYHRIWVWVAYQMGLNTDIMPLCPYLSSAVASSGLVGLALRMDDVRKTAIVFS